MSRWFTNPIKEILGIVFSRFLAPYVSNLDMNLVNLGIVQGQVILRRLHIKKGALDKFRLPVDVSEGHLGKLSLSLHWLNLGNKPVELLIEDVYLLVVPRLEDGLDPEEIERRMQAVKSERLENAELLQLRAAQAEGADGSPQDQTFVSSFLSKLVNNVQVTVKNVHIRYEDKISVPGHPFAAGVTLDGFSAVSTDGNWVPAFIEGSSKVVHKLAKLDHLAGYFDTDAQSMAGLPYEAAVERFYSMIAREDGPKDHQFVLKPVSGEGRITLRQNASKDVPRFGVQLLFPEIGVLLDDHQYRDVISLFDMLGVLRRKARYAKYRRQDEFKENRPRALLVFAGNVILDGVRERKRRWTWEFFVERRDDRRRYVELFKQKQLNACTDEKLSELTALERKLSYEDIRFYRSISRSELRKDGALRKQVEEERKKQEAAQSSGWSSWLPGWGSSTSTASSQESPFSSMTDQQRKELYEVLDYDEKTALAESFELPKEAIKAQFKLQLKKGTFGLKMDPHGIAKEIVSVVFDEFHATGIQRRDNLEVTTSLDGFSVFDGTTKDTLFPQLVHVKQETPVSAGGPNTGPEDPFFYVKFENNPLDERADTALTIRMRHMEIVYHKGYIEAIYKFFKPPPDRLESVEALLSVASETIEGFRKETRAGLEYALQAHKTIDVQVDMNAPIIIHHHAQMHTLLIDAGHISIESDLASKDAIRQVHLKRAQQYTEDDYKRLESLMYDKLNLRLKDAQFVLGDNLQACRNALNSRNESSLHLIERINIDLQVQNSIVPTVVNLARFKVSGKLPTLQLNFSDTKYKSILRLLDVTIPNFDDDSSAAGSTGAAVSVYPLSTGLFGGPEDEAEYNVDTDYEDAEENPQATDGGREEQGIEQKMFELAFQVTTLRASLYKSQGAAGEKSLGHVSFDNFALLFSLAQHDIKVAVRLGSLSMQVVEPGFEPLQILSSSNAHVEGRDLLIVDYTRVQATSPDLLTVYEGYDQNVKVNVSTLIFRTSPEPLVTLYDFLMTTFVPPSPVASETPSSAQGSQGVAQPSSGSPPAPDTGKMRILVKLASVEVILTNADTQIATLSLSTADASVILNATMNVHVRLGSLSLSDDSGAQTSSPDFKKLVFIQGEHLAELRYQTFGPKDPEIDKGINSSVSLIAASVTMHYLEQPLHDLYVFLMKLARLKGLYDAATEAAVQRASEIERMGFSVSVKTPIIIFPSNPSSSHDSLTMRLGEITASNSYKDGIPRTEASLRGMQLISTIFYDDQPCTLKMIDDIAIVTEVVQAGGSGSDASRPDTEVNVKVSDVKLALTEVQYGMLMALLRSIPNVLAGAPEGTTQAEISADSGRVEKQLRSEDHTESEVDLRPELDQHSGSHLRPTLDLILSVNAIKLQLFDRQATTEASLKEHGIARFALSDNTIRLEMLQDGAMQVQVVLKSFTVSNTAPGPSSFREIIPPAKDDKSQFKLLYTTSGSPNGSSSALLQVDSPHIIFSTAPVFALMEFFMSAFDTAAVVADGGSEDSTTVGQGTTVVAPNEQPPFQIRLDLKDVSISVLENDLDPETQAIRLTIAKIALSQQGILALTVERAGMSLLRMGKPEEARILDDVDLTLSLDSRTTSSHQMTSVNINFQPIVLRASYRDIMLMLEIANKAMEAYGKQTASSPTPPSRPSLAGPQSTGMRRVSGKSAQSQVSRQPLGTAHVVLSKEQLTASFETFRLILIGDLHEQPLLHLKIPSFVVGVNDWSGELQATTTVSTSIDYWNLTNSHWEPLIDPWVFTTSVSRELPSYALSTSFVSNERLNVNLSTAFMELALEMLKSLSRDGQHRLCREDTNAVEVSDGQMVDWRFDDWRTMREHTPSGNSSIAVQFVGHAWERLSGVPVDREGEYTFALRPRVEKYYNRLLCEVKVEASIKVVTLRSTYRVHNRTLYPLEVAIGEGGDHGSAGIVIKLAPGQDYSLPLAKIGKSRLRVQPDSGFGYKWSSPKALEDLVGSQQDTRTLTLLCDHRDPNEATFRFHAFVKTDTSGPPNNWKRYPKMDLYLMAPIQLENLLPYNLQYRIYDKDTDQNWRSYLRAGGIMPIHSVELSHLVLLNIEINDTTYSASEFSIINTDGHSDFDVESRLTLQDPRGRKLDLRLNYVRQPDAGGAVKVQIYSPYLVVNKTGLPFSERHLRLRNHSFYAILAPAEKSSSFRLTVNFEAPTADMELAIPSLGQKTPEETHVGLSWGEATGKYKLTKVITLAPRFLIKNNLSEPMCFREHSVAPHGKSTLESGERAPLHTLRTREKLLTVAFPGMNNQWSLPISIEDIGSIHFRLKRPGDQAQTHLVRADVKMNGATIFVSLDLADNDWPFLIENDSNYSDAAHADLDSSAKVNPVYRLSERSSRPYAWDFPAATEKKLLLTINGSRRAVDILEIGDLVPFKFQSDRGIGVVSMDVRASGRQQVLRLSNYDSETSPYRPKSRASSSTRVDTISSEAFEAVTEDIQPSLMFNVEFEGIGISLINRRVIEVVYLSLEKLRADYMTSSVAQSVNLSCQTVQIDNQLHDATFPVFLQPTPISKEASDVAAMPTVQLSVTWLNDQEHGVLFVKYCSILLQALTVQADEDFLYAVYELSKIRGASWEEEQRDILIEQPTDIPEPQNISGERNLYFEVLELQPVRLSLAFERTDRVSSEEKLELRNPLALIVNAVTMAVGNVKDAPLELNALAIKDMRLTSEDLQTRILYHYRQEVLRQLYRILGSADFIGNPVGLFTNVSSGVADIFYEPFNGAVVRGNRDIGVGIAKGAASFVKKTVFGFTDSFTKVTSSIGKGLSAATLDSEYQKRRRMNQRRNKPRHAIYGVTAGAEAFASSIASGVEGVVMKPIEGAESEGALGFFKGVGKGLIGAVTKPAVGIFDLASNLSEGVRNTTTVFDRPARERVRSPRHVPPDRVLVPFSEREALGQYWLKDVENGAYRQEFYVAHLNLPGGDGVALLTANRILTFGTTKLRLNWDLPLTQVQQIINEDRGIRFANKAGKEHDKYIFIEDRASQAWFYTKIASVVKSFNARRRMDS
ncbi:vacuolar protein sorting-associated protein 13 [Gloeopeniophorella convolvens]|nr:vacuolar protein sorting-associated protein 13 [Gloeopeniophorella convolvens]